MTDAGRVANLWSGVEISDLIMHDVTCSLVANLDVLQPKTVDDKVLAASDLKISKLTVVTMPV